MQWKGTLLPNQVQEEPEGRSHLSSRARARFGHTPVLQGVFRFVPWTREMLASILSDLLANDPSNLLLSKRPISLLDSTQTYFSFSLDPQEVSDPPIGQHPL